MLLLSLNLTFLSERETLLFVVVDLQDFFVLVLTVRKAVLIVSTEGSIFIVTSFFSADRGRSSFLTFKLTSRTSMWLFLFSWAGALSKGEIASAVLGLLDSSFGPS